MFICLICQHLGIVQCFIWRYWQ